MISKIQRGTVKATLQLNIWSVDKMIYEIFETRVQSVSIDRRPLKTNKKNDAGQGPGTSC